jgi:hypothetical protein
MDKKESKMTYTQGERYPISQYSCIQLQNGQVLRVGDYAMRRDGDIVKVDEYRNTNLFGGYFVADGWHYFHSGKHRYNCGDLDLIARVEVEYNPKLWKDMTPEEKGALLLARHEGKVIESFFTHIDEWMVTSKPLFLDCHAYRIKTEPKRESHRLFVYTRENDYLPTLIGTIDLLDGKPDPKSIKIGESHD